MIHTHKGIQICYIYEGLMVSACPGISPQPSARLQIQFGSIFQPQSFHSAFPLYTLNHTYLFHVALRLRRETGWRIGKRAGQVMTNSSASRATSTSTSPFVRHLILPFIGHIFVSSFPVYHSVEELSRLSHRLNSRLNTLTSIGAWFS
jgi:hypothetical protein